MCSFCAYCALTVRSMCIHLRSLLRFIGAHCSQYAHCALTVRLAFTYRSVRKYNTGIFLAYLWVRLPDPFPIEKSFPNLRP